MTETRSAQGSADRHDAEDGMRRGDEIDEAGTDLEAFDEQRAADEGMIAQPPEHVQSDEGSGSDRPEPRTDAEDPDEAIDEHPRTTEPDGHRVQVGWKVIDASGQHVGDVVERDDDSFVVSRASGEDHRTRFPTTAIADEDAERQRVTLRADA